MARRSKKRKGRNVNGILLLDKPAGMSSNEALQAAKRLYGAAKAGHTGSLDPLADGMLPLCFGEATKVSAFLLDSDKTYKVVCQLGSRTSTGDAEGDVIETRPVPDLDETGLVKILDQFMGEIEQIPPMYSALKHNGERLYKLARQGIEVERKPRRVTIYSLVLDAITDSSIALTVKCSKGTYIRTLAEDIGEALGCGAYVASLRRVAVSPYTAGDELVSLERISELVANAGDVDSGRTALDALLLPVESALQDWPDLHLNSDTAWYLRQGQAVQVPHAPSSGMVRLFGEQDEFIGLGQVQSDGKVAPKRLFFPPEQGC